MNRSVLSRRDLHRRALALALAPWLGAAAQAQQGAAGTHGLGPRWQADPFALGVASGQPQPDSVVLWTRLRVADADEALKAQSLPVLCEVFADEALRTACMWLPVVCNRGGIIGTALCAAAPAARWAAPAPARH
jgi:phosphodiesterase/alkaline phosphatase D-like protein